MLNFIYKKKKDAKFCLMGFNESGCLNYVLIWTGALLSAAEQSWFLLSCRSWLKSWVKVNYQRMTTHVWMIQVLPCMEQPRGYPYIQVKYNLLIQGGQQHGLSLIILMMVIRGIHFYTETLLI